MAGNGPAPKSHHQRERDTRRRQADVVKVKRDGVIRGPELKGDYSERTLEWYETWRRSPQARLFEETDWLRLSLLAPVVEAHYRSATTATLAEIRLNEASLGATVVDRLRARIRVERDTDPEEDSSSASAVGRTDTLARLMGEK